VDRTERHNSQGLSAEFIEQRDADHGAASPADALALSVLRSWHHHPVLRDRLIYFGLCLGEMGEHGLLERLVRVMVEAEKRRGP